MAGELKDLTVVVADLLVKEYGFTRKGRVFLREDDLLRSAVITPSKTATHGSYRFDVALNLGLLGLSSSSAARSEWVVSATVGKIHMMRERSAHRFEITGSAEEDCQVKASLVELLRVLCDEFLLKLNSPDDLIELILNRVDEFKRLDLWPWNEIPRIELACVYLEFIGEAQKAQDLQDRAVRLAVDQGMAYFPGRIRENMKMASLKRASSVRPGTSEGS